MKLLRVSIVHSKISLDRWGSAKEFAEITCIDLRVKHAKVIEHRTCDLNNSQSQGRNRATDIYTERHQNDAFALFAVEAV